jgi:DNA-binding response OmpR family regulator
MSQAKLLERQVNSKPGLEMLPSPKLSDKRMQSLRNDEEIYDDGYLRVEHKNYFVTCKGAFVPLSRTEFLLFSRMARSMDRVVRTIDLWERAWARQKPLNPESLHVTVCRLRRKFEPFGLRIDSMIGVGYSLSYRELPPNDPEPAQQVSSESLVESTD